jgi:hypothetical protein
VRHHISTASKNSSSLVLNRWPSKRSTVGADRW